MAAPVVVVQGLPPAPDLRRVVLSACSEALKHRTCTSADEQDRAAPVPSATAFIAWPEGEGRHVRVTLERFDAATGRRVERDTRFGDADPVIERWRTIGLVIAALVGESDASRDAAVEMESRPSSLRGRSLAASWLGLSGFAGPGLDDGSVRLGAAIHGAVGVRSSAVFFLGSAGHALRPVDDRSLDVGWTTFAFGAGARAHIPSADLELRVRVELLLEHLLASSVSRNAVSGGGGRWSPGLRCGGDVLWPASGPLGVTLGFSAWSLSGGTAIQLDQQKLSSSRWFSYAGLLGAEWSFR
jgi:hypothetical protein